MENSDSGTAMRPDSAHSQAVGSRTHATEDVNTIAEIRQIQAKLDDLIARLIPQPRAESGSPPGMEPEVDIYESDREFLIHAAVPGAFPDKIRIDATAHTITLSADVLAPAGQSSIPSGMPPGAKRHRRSRHSDHDRFYFVYTLHTAVVPEQARAVFRHGIVEIHLPKLHTAPISVSIPVTQFAAEPEAQTGSHQAPLPAGTAIAIISAQEGSPGRKLGAAYSPNPSEDHAAKARSVGDSPNAHRTGLARNPVAG